MSKYKILFGKKVEEVENKFECSLELMLDEMSKKDMSYKQMSVVLGVMVANIQAWIKLMGFAKPKRGPKRQAVPSPKELRERYNLSF